MNIEVDKDEMRAAFDVANKKKEEVEGKFEALDEKEFVDFYYLLMRRPEIDELFYKYADDEVNSNIYYHSFHVSVFII